MKRREDAQRFIFWVFDRVDSPQINCRERILDTERRRWVFSEEAVREALAFVAKQNRGILIKRIVCMHVLEGISPDNLAHKCGCATEEIERLLEEGRRVLRSDKLPIPLKRFPYPEYQIMEGKRSGVLK